MRTVLGYIRKASSLGSIGASGCILMIVILIVLEILVRSLVGRSTFITEEYSGYLLAWFAFLGMAETLRSDGHVRVSIVITRLGAKKRVMLEIVANAIGLAAFIYLAFYLGLVAFNSWKIGAQSIHLSQTPVFIPQLVPALGSILMAMQFFGQLIESIFNFFEAEGGLCHG